MSPDGIQSELTKLFCPPLDSILVASIAHEPEQTLQSAKEVCETLAAAAIAHEGEERQGTITSPKHASNAEGNEQQDTTVSSSGSAKGIPEHAAPQAKTRSSRARAFGGKLTQPETASTATSKPKSKTSTATSSSTPANLGRRQIQSHDFGDEEHTEHSRTMPGSYDHAGDLSGALPPHARSTASSSASTPSMSSVSSDRESVERLLEEWSLADPSSQDPDNLRLTDEDTDVESEPSSSKLDGTDVSLLRESARVGEMAGDGTIDPTSVASGQTAVSSIDQRDSPKSALVDPLQFLVHAFPARTSEFLKEMLQDAGGDVQSTIDTIMTIDLIEAEDAKEATLDATQSGSSSSTRPRNGVSGLDFEALARGISNSSGMEDLALKGKKRRAARKRLLEEQRKAQGHNTRSNNTHHGGKVTVNLTDVRHGGPMDAGLKKLQSLPNPKIAEKRDAISAQEADGLSDAELAAKIAAEERELARDPDADQPVTDNQWLLTSSVLSQLSTLLDVEATKVTSAYNSSSFNLPICFARLLEQESDKYPSLDSLDAVGGAPEGTALQIANSIAAISNMDLIAASKALRATKGRQDAALDLLQLQKLVKDSVGEADALDPLGQLRTLGQAEVGHGNAEAKDAHGFAIPASTNSGRFAEAFPTPSQAASSKHNAHAAEPAGVYSSVVGRKAAHGPGIGAAAALRSGSAAVASVLPASSTFVGTDPDGISNDPIAADRLGLAAHVSSHDPLRRSAEYRMIAEEYRARRNEALQKAATAWKTGRGGVRAGGKAGDGGRGGVAWHYADEARRLDAKSRAWSLRASQALVEDRRSGAVGVVTTVAGNAGSASARNTIDLHGVTVHEALSIVREQVTRWYSSPGYGLNPPPFRIVTGVGRHSPHQIAVLRPAIAKMLDREGWRCDVDHQRGVITVRGTK